MKNQGKQSKMDELCRAGDAERGVLHARVQSADGTAKCTLDGTSKGASRDHHSDIGGPECVLVNSAGVFSLASGAHFPKFRNGQVS